jgi:hypothetical protein
MTGTPGPRLVVQGDRRLAAALARLAGRRMVFFAGLPGTGKSLLVHQLAHWAAGAGRLVHLLQWDVARPVFEASPAGRPYPVTRGVTHPVIRKAAGRWARHAVIEWNRRHPEPEHLLIGEAPLVGARFIELARRIDDLAETLLTGESCRFVVSVPSREVRRFLEALRERRAARPLHAREREDAPVRVLRDLWRDLLRVADHLGLTGSGGTTDAPADGIEGADGTEPYDPDLYRQVYTTVLRHRRVEVIALDTILPTGTLSVYDFAVASPDVMPTEAEAEAFIREVEPGPGDPAALARETARWWEA